MATERGTIPVTFFASQAMVIVLTIPELVWVISSYLPSRVDVSSLSRCSRTLHGTVIPVLYRNIEFSVFKVDSLVESLKANASYSRYCRGLTIILNGLPSAKQAGAYRHTFINEISEGNSTSDIRDLRERIRSNIRYIIHACLVHGNIHQFAWNLENDNSHSFEWLAETVTVRDWREIILSKKTLQSLQFTVARGIQSSLGPLDKLVSTIGMTRKSGLTLSQGILSQHSFFSVSKLVLHITIQRYQVQSVRHLLSSFPNMKLLDLDIYHLSSTDISALVRSPGNERDTVFPDLGFKQLESLKFCGFVDSALICLDDFINKQPSLLELSVDAAEVHLRRPYSGLKALNASFAIFASFGARQAELLGSLSTIRIRIISVSEDRLEEFLSFVNELPRIRCIEIFFSLYTAFDTMELKVVTTLIRRIKKDISEIGIINHMFRKDGFNNDSRGFCTYANNLVSQPRKTKMYLLGSLTHFYRPIYLPLFPV